MYRIIKVLNNNGILVYHNETGRELILMGNGVGFGKKPTQQIEDMPGAKVYSLVTRQKQQSVLKVVNGIQPGFIEAAGRIIEEAEKVFSEVNHEILLPMADHIALAAKRAKENRQIPNPFTPDIRVLFSKEYTVAMRGRDIIREMMGYEISDDEVGFLTLHIHAGLSDEQVSVTLDTTRIINEGIRMIEKGFSRKLQEDSLAYTRLMSHLYYMVARTRNGESTKVDFNDFIFTNYPETGRVAEMVCSYMGNELKKPVAKEEIGFLAIHIQRVISPETL
ncbi:PRD domain-containing protein [Mediterraneibacter catenae]|uniref:PRD domain-containing protein n=1 Tax=Mediterraneibacter catenae TaxID=2594882 RepID=A0A5M9HVU5_9FIRM|nr:MULTISPECIES: PRD domain-containing protein [Mediterraneibacter]KAA8500747.1 PRD domain-containing protein [Mediterraneibacter catenae]MCF2568772.1 PRD domain-containing protein [Mediterraneibacter glycyrrhizinilyticus]